MENNKTNPWIMFFIGIMAMWICSNANESTLPASGMRNTLQSISGLGSIVGLILIITAIFKFIKKDK